jgi:hypothetical protein
VNYRKTPERAVNADDRRRTFTDEEGVFWDVREVPSPSYDRRGGHTLVFESANAFRRVRDYPADWFKLTEMQLMELSRNK